MTGRLWRIMRAGLFLLFVVLLTVLGPLQAGALPGPACSPTPAPSNSEEKNEHREGHKLRERLPGIAHHRRAVEPADPGHKPLPWTMQPGVGDAAGAAPADPALRTAKPHEKCFRELHSPAALQVFRH